MPQGSFCNHILWQVAKHENFVYFWYLPGAQRSVLKVSSFSIPSGFILKERIKHKVTLNVEEKNQSLLCRVKIWVVGTSIFGELNVTVTYILDNKVSEKVHLHTSTNKGLITVSFCPNIGTLGTSLPHSSWDCRTSAVAVKFTFPEE